MRCFAVRPHFAPRNTSPMRERGRPAGCPSLAFRASVAVLLAVAFAAGGCRHRHWPSLGTAHGRVTLQGKPVAAGTITFENAAAGVALSAAIAPDGSYRMKSYEGDGLPPGTYRVTISPQPFVVHHRTPFDPPPPAAPTPLADIPQKYRDVETTPLSAAVGPGENGPFDFDLTP
jgi:hypothetical protein